MLTIVRVVMSNNIDVAKFTVSLNRRSYITSAIHFPTFSTFKKIVNSFKFVLIKNLSFKFSFKTETKTKVDDELFGGNSAKAEMRKKLGFLFLILKKLLN